jgi:hypothetical protein
VGSGRDVETKSRNGFCIVVSSIGTAEAFRPWHLTTMTAILLCVPCHQLLRQTPSEAAGAWSQLGVIFPLRRRFPRPTMLYIAALLPGSGVFRARWDASEALFI